MSLNSFWFATIAVLWIGYFILEGFDFGVGILLKTVAKNQAERRAVLTTLGPVWDGNEVWLLVAGGATFAAFPNWYATLFSGFYLPLFLILISLIVRGVSFEYRSKYGKAQWRGRWDNAIVITSFIPALLWGVAFANIVRGVPLKNSNGVIEYAGGFFNLLNPYATTVFEKFVIYKVPKHEYKENIQEINEINVNLKEYTNDEEHNIDINNRKNIITKYSVGKYSFTKITPNSKPPKGSIMFKILLH